VGSADYLLESRWKVPADPGAVYAALADVESYPVWWAQVRRVRRIDDESGELICRSWLPYDLVFVVRREIEDADGRVLQARLDGDLVGWSRWTVESDGAVTTARFTQDVTVRKALVRRAGLLARPILRFNHDVMMREGERGLRRHLAAQAAAPTVDG
jgi:Polyketide cyclase / dehydrase and lipid transport